MTILGLDVSHWNSPDFPALVAAGHRYAYLKCTEGTTWRDLRYAAYKLNAGDAGLVTGAYHYFRVAFDGTAQADFFWSIAGNTYLPPAVDVESRNNTGFSQLAFRDQLRKYVIRITELSGRRPLLYTSKSQWNLLVGTAPDIAAQCDLWVADYGWDGNGNGLGIPRLPKDWTEWTIWQFTDKPLDQDQMKDSFWLSLSNELPTKRVIIEVSKDADIIEIVRK